MADFRNFLIAGHIKRKDKPHRSAGKKDSTAANDRVIIKFAELQCLSNVAFAQMHYGKCNLYDASYQAQSSYSRWQKRICDLVLLLYACVVMVCSLLSSLSLVSHLDDHRPETRRASRRCAPSSRMSAARVAVITFVRGPSVACVNRKLTG